MSPLLEWDSPHLSNDLKTEEKKFAVKTKQLA